jgi:hypothetical protein
MHVHLRPGLPEDQMSFFDSQLLAVAREAEAQLRLDLVSEHLDFEIEPALLEFRRTCYAWLALMAKQHERPTSPDPEPDEAQWLAFWRNRCALMRADVYETAVARHNDAVNGCMAALRLWRDTLSAQRQSARRAESATRAATEWDGKHVPRPVDVFFERGGDWDDE